MEKFFVLSRQQSLFLKGIAIIFVLLGHAEYIYKSGCWGVNLFMIISGYGIFASFRKNKLKNYFSNKIKKVYLPYFLVAIIFIIYYIFNNRTFFSKKVIFTTLVGLDLNYNFDKTMWYISYIFLQYFIFYFFAFFACFLIKNQKVRDYLILLFTFLINIFIYQIFDFLFPNVLIWNSGAGVFLYKYSFSIGLFLFLLSDISIKKILKNNIYKLLIFFSFAALICLYNNVGISTIRYAIYVHLMPIIILSFMQLDIVNCNNKYIYFMGKYSYDIYLWEGFFLFSHNNWFSVFELKIFNDIVTILITISVAYFYRKIVIDSVNNFSFKKCNSFLFSSLL